MGTKERMEIARTPEERFEGLVEYPFEPHYVEVPSGLGDTQLRVHYVDEGPRDAQECCLLMCGQPAWSYVWRKCIPPLVAAGYRVLAPDLGGFGKSDKPVAKECYTVTAHLEWMTAWIDAVW